MASPYRLAASALLEVTPRKVLSASFSQSASLSSTALSTESLVSPGVPKVFDIFDVPVKLRERNTPNELTKAHNSLSTAQVSPSAGHPQSKCIYSDALGLPWSLPPPVTFDGPARPPHMSPSTLRKHRLQRQNLTHPLKGGTESSMVSCTAFMAPSEPLYQLFDGPSRITRYQYPMSQNERYSYTYVSLALCLSSTFGWLVLKDNLDLQQK